MADQKSHQDIMNLQVKFRHVKMWLLHKRGLSRKEIAELLGGTNPGAVGNEIKKYEKDTNRQKMAEALLDTKVDVAMVEKTLEKAKKETLVSKPSDPFNYKVKLVEIPDTKYAKGSKSIIAIRDKKEIHLGVLKKESEWYSPDERSKISTHTRTVYKWKWDKDGLKEFFGFEVTPVYRFTTRRHEGPTINDSESTSGAPNAKRFKEIIDEKIKEFSVVYDEDFAASNKLTSGSRLVGYRYEIGDKVGLSPEDINWVVKDRRNNFDTNFYTLEYQGTDSEVEDKTSEYDESQLTSGSRLLGTGTKLNPANANTPEGGGLLVGVKHTPTGRGIEVETPEGRIKAEGGEILLNAKTSERLCEQLSAESVKDGGVAFPCDKSDAVQGPMAGKGTQIPVAEWSMPDGRIHHYAESIRKNYPDIWKAGGNEFGNQAYENLSRVLERGYWLQDEESMYKRWRSFIARHQHDKLLAGVIANLKWLNYPNIGENAVKEVIDEAITKQLKGDGAHFGAKPYYTLTREETIAERDAGTTRRTELNRHSIAEWGMVLEELK